MQRKVDLVVLAEYQIPLLTLVESYRGTTPLQKSTDFHVWHQEIIAVFENKVNSRVPAVASYQKMNFSAN